MTTEGTLPFSIVWHGVNTTNQHNENPGNVMVIIHCQLKNYVINSVKKCSY